MTEFNINSTTMSKEITIFNNERFGEIRTAGTPEEPLFCLSDICKALELPQVSRVRSRLKKDGLILIKVTDSLGRQQETLFCNEQNLYRVIMRSDKPNAESFQDWVCGEVLPEIRKTGRYEVVKNTITLPDFSNPAEAARAWAEQYEQKMIETRRADEAEKQVLLLSNEIESMQPKVSYYDTILASKETVTITQIAQDYGMSAKALNKTLEELRVQHKVNGQWILYAPFISQGYVHSKPVNITRSDGRADVKMNTEWTQKGRLFLYNGLKNHGILPLIER